MTPEVQNALQDKLGDMVYAMRDLLDIAEKLMRYVDWADVIEVKDDDT